MRLNAAKNDVRKRMTGVSLIEVLVTLVVVAIGLLGVAGLQITALKLGFVAESRSAGVIFVNDIMDRMRANSAGIAGYATNFGTAATAVSTQAEKDLKVWKDGLKTLADGDGKITVTKGVLGSCDAPTVANCWDVKIEVRWSEANTRGGTGTTSPRLTVNTRI
jgi:type IV pilus assembly protein PilV